MCRDDVEVACCFWDGGWMWFLITFCLWLVEWGSAHFLNCTKVESYPELPRTEWVKNLRNFSSPWLLVFIWVILHDFTTIQQKLPTNHSFPVFFSAASKFHSFTCQGFTESRTSLPEFQSGSLDPALVWTASQTRLMKISLGGVYVKYNLHIYIYTYIYMYIHMCDCVCVCVKY